MHIVSNFFCRSVKPFSYDTVPVSLGRGGGGRRRGGGGREEQQQYKPHHLLPGEGAGINNSKIQHWKIEMYFYNFFPLFQL